MSVNDTTLCYCLSFLAIGTSGLHAQERTGDLRDADCFVDACLGRNYSMASHGNQMPCEVCFVPLAHQPAPWNSVEPNYYPGTVQTCSHATSKHRNGLTDDIRVKVTLAETIIHTYTFVTAGKEMMTMTGERAPTHCSFCSLPPDAFPYHRISVTLKRSAISYGGEQDLQLCSHKRLHARGTNDLAMANPTIK